METRLMVFYTKHTNRARVLVHVTSHYNPEEGSSSTFIYKQIVGAPSLNPFFQIAVNDGSSGL